MKRSDADRVRAVRAAVEKALTAERIVDVDERLVVANAAVRLLEREEGVGVNVGGAKRRVEIHARAAHLADRAREVV